MLLAPAAPCCLPHGGRPGAAPGNRGAGDQVHDGAPHTVPRKDASQQDSGLGDHPTLTSGTGPYTRNVYWIQDYLPTAFQISITQRIWCLLVLVQ